METKPSTERSRRTCASARLEVMVVDRDRARCTQVSEAFRAEGCHVVEATSSLDALRALIGTHVAIDLIAVADTMPENEADDLREYLDTYATSRVIAIGEQEWTPTRPRLDPSDSSSLRARVKSLLPA